MTDVQSYSGPNRVFSGIQPTGNLHLGNYLGALKKFVDLQAAGWTGIYCVVDLHAITQPHDPALLPDQTRQIAAAMLACGLDPDQSTVFVQSAVPAHAELAWIFNCVARMGWLEKMTQFKDKGGENSERVSVGLFDYPVLQAADILAYRATHVPVGEDQQQHLELSRNIAARFNQQYDAPGFFPEPEALIEGPGARIMSLKDGSKKMSKSDPSDLSRINLVDDRDTIARKIKKAKTDLLGDLPETEDGLEGRPEVENLVGIYSAFSGQSVEAVLAEFGGAGFGTFKPALAELAISHLAPITERMRAYMADPAEIDRALQKGAEKAHAISAPVIKEVRDVIGFWKS
ncbi:MAG: tryptophan--tRNA ligase [Hyphomonadaceae bacterium]|nr:tryptophan--tRNA ligase [Hyphomonadaceae bacterium]OUX94444.1 MAG: tryptophan--tRNA ligase [Hyphomonas sp. TMED17]